MAIIIAYISLIVSNYLLVSAYNNGVAQRPAMGWNTWCSIENCGYDVCTDNQIRQTAQAMKSNGMFDAGYTRINLDDCWGACNRASDGSIQPDSDRFPNGMKPLVQYVQSLGFKFGLYTSAGTTGCNAGQRNCKPAGSWGHYEQDAQTFADWGLDFVKLDWCGSQLNNAQQQHTQFSQAMNATGRHMWLELCRGYTFPPPPYVAQVANSWRIYEDHFDTFSTATHGTRNAVQRSINATSMSKTYNWAFNDFLMTGGQGCSGGNNNNPDVTHPHCPGQTELEYITEFSLWAIIASPLLVATDVRNFTATMKTVLLNEEVIAINQNNVYAAGNIVSDQTRNCDGSVTDACQIWARQVGTNVVGIIFYNSGESAHNITVNFRTILNMGWSGKNIQLRDIWEKKSVGTFVNEYMALVPPHGVQFVTATQQ